MLLGGLRNSASLEQWLQRHTTPLFGDGRQPLPKTRSSTRRTKPYRDRRLLLTPRSSSCPLKKKTKRRRRFQAGCQWARKTKKSVTLSVPRLFHLHDKGRAETELKHTGSDRMLCLLRDEGTSKNVGTFFVALKHGSAETWVWTASNCWLCTLLQKRWPASSRMRLKWARSKGIERVSTLSG